MSDRSERVLKLIAALLDTRRPLTRHEIQERVEGYSPDPDAFRRTFEHDKDMLRTELEIDVEVDTIPGTDPPELGYRIRGDRYRLEDPGLTLDELAAINLAANRVRLSGVDPVTGLQKLGGFAGGPSPADELATLPESPHVPMVFQAFREKRRLRFTYGNTEREVDPYRLHLERGRWYLQGFDHSRVDVRVFRLDRIVGDLGVDDPGTATDPDLEAVASGVELQGWIAGEEEPVLARVLVDADQAAVARRMVGDGTTVIERDDGSVVFEMNVRRREALRNFVLGFLDSAEVLEPPDLRADMIVWLERVAAEPT